MMYQISSGLGPVECRFAVGGIYQALEKEYGDLELVSGNPGEVEGAYSSILFSSEEPHEELEGTMEWICKSPFRKGHKRKNWFVDVSIIPEAEEICDDPDITVERFHAGGNGGQNVNKVETGIRVIHRPTGITVTSTRERSQYLNKQDALKKLSAVLKHMQSASKEKQKNDAWRKHTRIVRGNPVRIYEGMKFVLRKEKKGEKDI